MKRHPVFMNWRFNIKMAISPKLTCRFHVTLSKFQSAIWRNWKAFSKIHRVFPGSSAVKNLPAVWETWVQSLVPEDPLEKGMATHSNILVWRIPWTEEPGKLQSMGLERVTHNWETNTFTFSKIHMEMQSFRIAKIFLKKKKAGECSLHNFKIYKKLQ